jgi:probable HAF family extracellular repeat protein
MKKTQLVLIACLGLGLCPFVGAASQHAFIWNNSTGMQDLGTLGGNTSYALGINDNGEVVGFSFLADNLTTHAFTWTEAGGMVDLGTFTGFNSTEGWCINSAGNLAGDAIEPSGRRVPFFWSPAGGFQTLAPNTGDLRNYAFGINDADVVTGQQYGNGSSGEVVHAYYWAVDNGVKRDLPPLTNGLHSVGNDINNRNQITGTASIPNNGGVFHAIFWTKTGGTRDIGGVAGQSYTAGRAINDNGEVAGFAGNSAVGFYWSRATGMILLQTLGGTQSAAYAINNNGTLAGFTANAGGAIHAVIWPDKNSAPQDLGALSGGTNSYAQGINSSGQVVGYSDVP